MTFPRPVDVLAGASPALSPGRPASRPRHLVLLAVCFGMLYGAVMGGFGAFEGRPWQMLLSAVKVPLLVTVTFALSLPSFFVINTLVGVRGDFPHVLRALLACQAALTIVLAGLAPLTVFWYVSCANYSAAVLFNVLMFAVAGVAAQSLLRRHYRPLISRRRRHRWLLRTWLGIYAFVGVQMGWVLRPFIGSPGMPTRIFRVNAWSNAYVALVAIVSQMLKG